MHICVSLHLFGFVNVLVNTKEEDKSCLFLILLELFDLSLLVLAAAWLFFLICKLQSQSEVKTLDKDRITKTTATGLCNGKKWRSWAVEYCLFLDMAGGEIICLLHITFLDLNIWSSWSLCTCLEIYLTKKWRMQPCTEGLDILWLFLVQAIWK